MYPDCFWKAVSSNIYVTGCEASTNCRGGAWRRFWAFEMIGKRLKDGPARLRWRQSSTAASLHPFLTVRRCLSLGVRHAGSDPTDRPIAAFGLTLTPGRRRGKIIYREKP